MSQNVKASAVVRCPLCRDGGTPAHVGHSVFVCECCGNRYRIVFANVGKTGKRLGDEINSKIKFAPQ